MGLQILYCFQTSQRYSKKTNMKVSVVNIVRQSSKVSNGKREVLFDYHIDSKLVKRNIQVFVIFMITHT